MPHPVSAPPAREGLPPRPALKAALRPLWRDPATLQLGLGPQHSVVLSGLDPADGRLLELLDGSRDTDALLAAADAAGVDRDRLLTLLDALASGDALDSSTPGEERLAPDLMSLSLLHPGPGAAARVLSARRGAAVDVHGGGRVGSTLAGLLTAAGVGRCTVVDDEPARPADLCPGGLRETAAQARGQAATEAARTFALAAENTAARLVVVAPAGASTTPETLTAVRRRPHLFVAVRETTAVVGPLVLPGATPCLRCVELARGDRDARWPSLSAQLLGTARRLEPCDVVLATLAAGLAAMQALAYLDGRDAVLSTIGGVLELSLLDGRMRRRSLAAHPACGCGAAAATMEE